MATTYTVPLAGPQNSFTNDQNYDVDIKQLYDDFIGAVDAIRSHVSVQNNPSIQGITSSIASNTPSNLVVDKDPQESRCHAFFRLLGLPVTDGKVLYSPGIDIPNNSNKTSVTAKIEIAKKVFKVPGMQILFDTREKIPRDFAAIFADQDVDATTLAMTLAEPREMNASTKNVKTGAFPDASLNNQSYINTMTTRFIVSAGVLPEDEQPDVGAPPGGISANRKHILFPFTVDPRIDFNVFPKRNTLAVPFLADKNQTKLTDGVYLTRPYIEKVCRDRFSGNNVTLSLGSHTQSIIQNIKNLPFIKDDALIKQAFGTSNNSTYTSEAVQFANYINSMRSILQQLNDAIHTIYPVLAADPKSNGVAQYNWMPIPNKQGPEYGSTTQDLLVQENDSRNTDQDLHIIKMIYSQALTNISNKLATLQIVDIGGAAFDGTEPTPDQNSTTANGDLTQQQITSAQNDRSSLTNAANAAIQTIEIIMGEFSGLGLIDVLVICATFWLVKPSTLLSLLDDTAINRMVTNAHLNSSDVLNRKNGVAQVGTALVDFQNTVKQVYDLCQQLWDDIRGSNGT